MSIATISAASTVGSSESKYAGVGPQLANLIQRSDIAYNAAMTRNDHWGAYHAMLEEVGYINRMAPSEKRTKWLIWGNTNLVITGSKVRETKATQESHIVLATLGFMFFCITLPCLPCLIFRAHSQEWVTDSDMQSHLDRAKTTINNWIKELKNSHNIDMNTEKSSVSEEVRKSLGFAYFKLGYLNEFGERWAPNSGICCMSAGSQPISADLAAAHSLYQKAAEWNPNSLDYSAAATRMKANLNKPTVYHAISQAWAPNANDTPRI